MMLNLVNLRRTLCAQRKALSPLEQKRLSQACCHHIMQFLQSRIRPLETVRFAWYWPVNGELDLQPLVNRLWPLKAQGYLPRLLDTPERTLIFLPDLLPQATNKFNIPEPQGGPEQAIPLDQLNCIFMPLTAFDVQGHRLGMGGGYYDTTLAQLACQPERKTLFIGCGYAFQEVENLAPQPWDIACDMIFTEEGCTVNRTGEHWPAGHPL